MRMYDRSSYSYEYRYGYQGSEKDDEIKGEGNSYTTHFRLLDPRIGRWLTVDPKAKLLPFYSPYSSMNGNPIRFNDTFGDIVKLEGKNKDKRKFKRQLQRTTGNKYKIDKNGILSNRGKSSNVSSNSKQSGELSGIVGSAIADSETFSLTLVRNDDNTLIDSYDRGTVDVGDFAKMSRIMKAGQFAHFLTERLENPGNYSLANRTNANFVIAHNKAKVAESRVVNAMLGQTYLLVVQSDNVVPRYDNVGNVIGYFYRARSTYGTKSFGFDYGAVIVPMGGGKSRVDPTGVMLNRFKKR